MTSSLGMIRGRSNIVTLTNNSGGALVAGDVCVQDTSADEKVTTTTSAASVLKVFVAAESIANGAAGRFYESGYCPLVNVNASVTRGRFLFTHTVAKQAAENATYGSGAFGKILKSGTTPSAIIYSATAQISGSSVTRSGSTTGDHLAVWDGSNADSIKDGGAVGAGGAATTDHFIVGQGGEGDTDLSAKVIIPRLSGDPDIRVAGVNDDEFDTTDTSDPMTGWTTMGSPTAHNINSTAKSHYYIKVNANASTAFCGIYKAMSSPFTVTCKVADLTNVGNYNTAALFVAEAAPGKMWTISVQYSNAPFTVRTESWTSPTSGSANGAGFAERVAPPPVYLRIVVNSTTNVDFLFSKTGFIYTPVSSAVNPGFTIGSVGIAVQPINASFAMQAAFDWIRFT